MHSVVCEKFVSFGVGKFSEHGPYKDQIKLQNKKSFAAENAAVGLPKSGGVKPKQAPQKPRGSEVYLAPENGKYTVEADREKIHLILQEVLKKKILSCVERLGLGDYI